MKSKVYFIDYTQHPGAVSKNQRQDLTTVSAHLKIDLTTIIIIIVVGPSIIIIIISKRE